MNVKLNQQKVVEFIFGGKSTFTVRNVETGNRFTYMLTRKKSLKEGDEDVIFVKVLNGSDNNNDYTFLGTIFGKKEYKHSPKSRFGANCQSTKAIEWLVRNIRSLPPKVEVWHEGKCARCGRKLTVPESIESGFGPECGSML